MISPASDAPAALTRDLQPAHAGRGPLLQRDYWAVIDGARVRPSELAYVLCRRFHEFAPPELVAFSRCGEGSPENPLEVGDELDVAITGAGTFRVRVVCRQPQSITLATLKGHPEAGRITFGAYRNKQGAVIFHIRSRARSSDGLRYLGYLLAGEPMQTNTWTDFVKAVANTFGNGVVGAVQVQTTPVSDDESAEEEGEEQLCSPTFLAEGD